ncbi:MAG: DUF1294 domain-containing protein [Lachnospiraceae bacterium]|nr:DUF1294 domain-containing protein [Lachnospiraceae bacterium]
MKTFFTVICVYFAIVNLWGFISMGIDKRRAERNQWRISEFSLFVPAFLGGALGCIIGMYFFHHKTRHMKFVIGMPLILFIYLAIILWFIFFSPYKLSFM